MRKRAGITTTALALLLGSVTCSVVSWAGSVEEVAALAAKRGQAFSEGNADAYVADFADDAVFTAAGPAFRIEGKAAIRAFFAGLFQSYPQRRSAPRQVMSRVYGEDSVVVVNAYADQLWVDRNGQVFNPAVRSSMVWVKIGGRWLTVDAHVSRIPVRR